jgi:opacity protein-like surface antigen
MRIALPVLTAALLTGVSLPVLAADLPPMPLPPIEQAPPILFESNGWYLRGDVGVAAYDSGDWTQEPLDNNSKIISNEMLSTTVGDGAIIGLGVGYQFNPWFRADATLEYRAGVTASGFLRQHTQYGSEDGDVDFYGDNLYNGGKLRSIVGLLNAYVDMGTWAGVTPFVGVGLGFASNSLSGFTDSGVASEYIDGIVYNGNSPTYTNSVGSGTATNFAWALHAGLAYTVNPNLKLELSYRYLNLGEAESGNVYCFTPGQHACDQIGAPIYINDLTAQDIRLGMRWTFASGVAAPLPMEPIVRKY